MEDMIAIIESHTAQFNNVNEAAEQYQYRRWLRINGSNLPLDGSKETGEECHEKVKDFLDKS